MLTSLLIIDTLRSWRKDQTDNTPFMNLLANGATRVFHPEPLVDLHLVTWDAGEYTTPTIGIEIWRHSTECPNPGVIPFAKEKPVGGTFTDVDLAVNDICKKYAKVMEVTINRIIHSDYCTNVYFTPHQKDPVVDFSWLQETSN